MPLAHRIFGDERTCVSALSSSASECDSILDFNWWSEGDRLYFLDDDGNHMSIDAAYHAGDLTASVQSLGDALSLAFADANGTAQGVLAIGRGMR
ncbi:hypothetical protein MTBLM1_20290 [Rhodospirillaceae bacterium LM-1]|nr:hypothetical protein MTBLM1_20290 [Rhodospirillaceae bacterium LM-1]